MIADASRLADEWLADLAGAHTPAIRGLRPVGVGWATVELERAAAELTATLPGRPSFELAADDELLGARCRLTAPTGSRRLAWVLLEPSTEGRLAATLARHGEGLSVAWFVGRGRLVEASLSVVAHGPLGPARYLVPRPVTGPHVAILESAAWPSHDSTGTIRA